MAEDITPPEPWAPQQSWHLFEQLCGARVRASDASWSQGLSPAQRLTLADDLFATVRGARIAAGDWQQVDQRSWQAALDERVSQVQAFKRLDEATRGTSPLANTG